MELTRLVELSLFFKLQNILAIDKTADVPKSADFQTYNLKYTTVQEDRPVVVKVNGILQNSSLYSIDYINGLIKFNNKLLSTDNVTVDYTYCFVNIYDESKSPYGNDFKYPAVSSYEYDGDEIPFELGNAKKERESIWMLDVWAERGGERNDITDIIMKLTQEMTIPIIDYGLGFPFNTDGTANINFNATSQTIGYIVVEGIKYRKGGSLSIGEKPVFLTTMTADLTIYT